MQQQQQYNILSNESSADSHDWSACVCVSVCVWFSEKQIMFDNVRQIRLAKLIYRQE